MSGILHTVNKSPFTHFALKQCIHRICADDSLILLEDGVYAALMHHPYIAGISSLPRCYAIKGDLEARGLVLDKLCPNIQLIDYNMFVSLSTEHTMVQSWY